MNQLAQFQELETYKKALEEKDSKVKELEIEIAELKQKNSEMVQSSSEDPLRKIWDDRLNLTEQNRVLKNQIENWETAYNHLHEQTKAIVEGLAENQLIWQKELENEKNILQKKYDSYKTDWSLKSAELEMEIANKERENAELKSQLHILEAKMNELEKYYKLEVVRRCHPKKNKSKL